MDTYNKFKWIKYQVFSKSDHSRFPPLGPIGKLDRVLSRNIGLTLFQLRGPQNLAHRDVLGSFTGTVNELLEAHPDRLYGTNLMVRFFWSNTYCALLGG